MSEELIPQPQGAAHTPAQQQVTVADLTSLAEAAVSVAQAIVEPQEETKRQELQVEAKEIEADERGVRRLLIAVVLVFLSVVALAALLILRNHDELAVSLVDRILYFLAGGLGGWGVARARQRGEYADPRMSKG